MGLGRVAESGRARIDADDPIETWSAGTWYRNRRCRPRFSFNKWCHLSLVATDTMTAVLGE